jgi:L-malate glycosyltransferase
VKIGIYNEPSEGGLGGCEFSVAVLAEALGPSDDVEIIHHRPTLTLQYLADYAAADLSAVRLRYVDFEPFSCGTSYNPWKRTQEARRWQATLSEPYDIFINFTHHYPPYCHAPRGILNVLFPLHERPLTEFQAEALRRGGKLRWQKFKSLYYEQDWNRRMESYQLRFSISEFTRNWTKRRWAIDSQVVYPPVHMNPCIGDKANLILSVGRFTTTGHSKRQWEMTNTFAEMHQSGLQDWQYYCVGGLSDSPSDQAYFNRVRKQSAPYPLKVLANVERARLIEFRKQAKIFWHAAGYGIEAERPELMEHFGIATIEAMAAGCVPIIVNRGGHLELIEHGVTGFLWDTLDELKDYTLQIVSNDKMRTQMAEAARARSRAFSRESFIEAFRKHMNISDSRSISERGL